MPDQPTPDVPDDLLELAMRAWSDNGPGKPGNWSAEQQVRAILAAVLPEARRRWFSELMGTDAVAAREADAAKRTRDDTVDLCERARPGEHARRVLRGAADALLAEDFHDDRCSYGPPGTCDCSLGEHYRWLINRSENGDTHGTR